MSDDPRRIKIRGVHLPHSKQVLVTIVQCEATYGNTERYPEGFLGTIAYLIKTYGEGARITGVGSDGKHDFQLGNERTSNVISLEHWEILKTTVNEYNAWIDTDPDTDPEDDDDYDDPDWDADDDDD